MITLGFALLLLGIVLMVAEAHVPSGALGAAGAVALVVGGVVALGGLGSGAAVIVPVAIALALVGAGWVLVAARNVAGARRLRVRSGREALCGEVGVLRGWAEPAGQVFVGGALWRARRSWGEAEAGPPLHDGDLVVVERVDGLTLSVRAAEEWEVMA